MLEYLLQQHPESNYVALVRNQTSLRTGNLELIKNRIKIIYCDLENYQELVKCLSDIAPDQVYHFASYANVKESFSNPLKTIHNNINGTAHLFEACRMLEKKPKILLCSTSEVYGQVSPDEVPITEQNAIRPANPYAVSKTTQDLLAQVYWQAYKLPIVRVRMFTYINPRRNDLFATAFALQIAKIELGQQSELTHGNLQSIRTHLDIRDVVSAYYEALNNGLPGEVYNIGGLESYSVGDLLNELIKLSSVPIKTRLDDQLLRPVDVTLQIPDIAKFNKISKWVPRYSFKESLIFLLKGCRDQVSKN